MSLRFRFCLLYTLSLVLLVGISATNAAPPEEDSVDRDYRDELPRIAPKEPADALATFSLAPDFRIEQVACEPIVVDPIAIAFDENGRLYAIEMRGYSENAEDNLGRVRMLEDTNGDGRFDKSEVFVDGLSWPTAIACYDGGVFVGAAPDIHYFKDTDGDNKSDLHKLAYTGFGVSNVQGLLNTFKWGLDNRLHGATSSSGASVTPGEEPNAEPLVLRGRDFAFDPATMQINATSGGAQHGLSFSAWGDKFVCSNSDHIQHVLFEDRYVARNPYLAAPGARSSIAADGPQADVFRASPVEPWRIVRTRLRKKGLVPGPVEGGGTPAGYFTGATGVTIYRGNDWPEQYQGWAIIGDVGSNLVHRKRLDASGLSFTAQRVDEKTEFLRSSDIWFRPVQFANAPDGGLYIIDMYREVIEHPKSLPPVIKQHLDLTSGRDRGRIYRVVSDGFEQPPLPKLGSASTNELVALLAHENGWQRETASRLLYERQDKSAIGPLEKLAAESDAPLARMHALYALDGLGALSAEAILPRLDDDHPRVREHAVRLAERVAASSLPVREKLYAMTGDDELRVRYQFAFTLGELHGPQRNRALAKLARTDADNGLMQLAVRSSLFEGSGAVLAELAADEKYRDTQPGREMIRGLAAQIGKQQQGDDVATVLQTLSELSAAPETLQTIVAGLAAKPGSELAEKIAAATGGRADELLREVVLRSLAAAQDQKLPVEERTGAIAQLRLGSFADCRDVLDELLAPTEPAEVQAAAIAVVAAFDDAEVADLLVGRWKELSPSVRSRAAEVFFSRDVWLPQLFEAVESGSIALGDLEPGRLKLLASHADMKIREKAAGLLEKTGVGQRGEVVEAYRKALEMSGDTVRGKAVFKKNCSVCHKLEGEGFEIGPNLAAMRNRGPETILLNVLAPNREVNPQYMSYAVITTDGRSLTGMIDAETATSVTLRRAENQSDTVLRIDIDEMRSTGVSLMPDGLEKEIDQQAMADLLAYLTSLE